MSDYKCDTIISFDYLHHGKWETKCLGFETLNLGRRLSNEEILDSIQSYYPSVLPSSVLFMIRIDDPDVWLSDVEAYFKCIKCRALVDKNFNVGEIVIVNKKLFDQYLKNTIAIERKEKNNV